MTKSKIKLKEVLKRECSNRGLDIKTLSAQCGIPHQTLLDWTNGRLPSGKNLDKLHDLSTFLGISISELLFSVREERPKSVILVSTVFRDNDRQYKLTIEREDDNEITIKTSK